MCMVSCYVACSPSITSVSKTGGYEEDLSVHRPTYNFSEEEQQNPTEVVELEKPNVVPTHHIKDELDSVMSAIILSKKNIRYINGYSIQVYSGNDRNKAAQVRETVMSISEGFEPKISYNQPNYKVKVGKYFSRIEANKDLVALKNEFRQALLVPDKIPIE